ncbi:MAG: type I restriction enzyme HsdR N-terminal domain-containing protein [Gammaproteobacteria bacterium]|tara:strand:- start:158 stop:1186 length:1029 start_codon:yes stop_codon:yes gene_type:complete
MASIKQIASLLEKSFSKWDFKRAIKLSDNESKTRDYLIEPFFNMLGYTKMEHYSHEYSLRLGKGSVKKIDMVVSLNGRTPIMLVECKKANSNLTGNHYKQLAQYYDNHRESKIGILTNGVVYEFYAVRWDDSKKLSNSPFLVFDLRDFTRADLEDIAQFHLQLFHVKKILEISEEKYFLDDFNAALTKTLHPVGDGLIKLIYKNMGGKRLNEKISKRINNLTNSVSLENSIEIVKVLEGKQSSSGIYTSSKELKAYQIIKTILVMNPKIKNYSERLGHKDYRGHFKVVFDDMPSKEICQLYISNTTKKLVIRGEVFELQKVSTVELTKHRRKLVDAALQYVE